MGVVEQVGSSVNHLKKGDHVGKDCPAESSPAHLAPRPLPNLFQPYHPLRAVLEPPLIAHCPVYSVVIDLHVNGLLPAVQVLGGSEMRAWNVMLASRAMMYAPAPSSCCLGISAGIF